MLWKSEIILEALRIFEMKEYDRSLEIQDPQFWEEMYLNLFEMIITKSAYEIRKSFIDSVRNGKLARIRCEEAMLYFAEKEEFCKAYIMQCVAKEIKDYEHINLEE
jgi:hypothetical protein